MARVGVLYNAKEINAFQYPIVVQMWDKKNSGRIGRAWRKEFNEQERQKAYFWYRRFYKWYLVRGTPEHHWFLPETIQFIERLVNFFGTV